MRDTLIPLSIGLMVLASSCKEQNDAMEPAAKTEAVKEVTESTLSPEEKKLKTAEKKIGWIMQDMEVPEYKIDKLVKKGKFLSEDFLKYANQLINNAKKVKEVEYPDEKFTGLSKKMLEALSGFESALSSKNPDELKTSWSALTKSCAACHKDYKKGGGGY